MRRRPASPQKHPNRRVCPMCGVKKVDAIGQEDRETVTGGTAFRDFGHRNGNASGRRHAENDAGGTRREQNHVVAIPGSAAAAGRIAQGLGRATRDGDLLELAFREEPQVRAIRRPERIVRSVRSRQRASIPACPWRGPTPGSARHCWRRKRSSVHPATAQDTGPAQPPAWESDSAGSAPPAASRGNGRTDKDSVVRSNSPRRRDPGPTSGLSSAGAGASSPCNSPHVPDVPQPLLGIFLQTPFGAAAALSPELAPVPAPW